MQDTEQEDITIFMGVPTMYSYLLSAYDDMSTAEQARARCGVVIRHNTVPGSCCPCTHRTVHLQGCRGAAPTYSERLGAVPAQCDAAMERNFR